ncbi:hypothetical protein CR161_06325 [Prosthecochloris sp. ZM]|uniref:hypothetical protein n=1 Tax=Prosthecochloris sp. ZM TaxID=2283143 RepID=UPI000DF7C9EE|nr:hypothetical protein [Prosthecochloris sp. ZM]RDD30360.1 hypothetical protein CR161_06325 [Prosthecochloris sp. ZM]
MLQRHNTPAGNNSVRIYARTFLLLLALLAFPFRDALRAEDEHEDSSPLSFTLRARGEAEWIDLRDSRLNPENVLGRYDNRYEGFLLGTIDYKGVDGYFSGEFRAGYEYLSGEMHEGTSFDDNEATLEINQLYYRTAARNIEVLLGRKKVRWGVGYAYSPTDLVTRQKNPEDPADRLSKVRGADLVGVSRLSESSQLDVLYFPELNWDFEDDFVTMNRFGMRWYRFVDPFDLSLVGSVNDDGDWTAGVNTSFTVGTSLELHAEYAYTSYNPRNDFLNRLDPDHPLYAYPAGPDDGVHDILIGGQYTFENNLNLVVEYMYRGGGYESDQLDSYIEAAGLWMNSGALSTSEMAGIVNGADQDALNAAAPLRSNYLFAGIFHPEVIRSVSLDLYSYLGLEDGSGFIVVMPTYKQSDSIDIYLRLKQFWGDSDTEFGLVPDDFSCVAGISWFLGS